MKKTLSVHSGAYIYSPGKRTSHSEVENNKKKSDSIAELCKERSYVSDITYFFHNYTNVYCYFRTDSV